MKDYIAWLGYGPGNGASVARGTLKEVERKAREIAETELWKAHANGRETHLRITRGARQLFVKAVVLP